MTQFEASWPGGEIGPVVLRTPDEVVIPTPEDVAAFVRARTATLFPAVLQPLGSIAYFMCLRNCRWSALGAVLQDARTEFDALDLGDDTLQRRFASGATLLAEHLHRHRSEPAYVLIAEAFRYIETRI